MVFSISNLIFTNMITSNYKIVAVMSGTSLDGIDIIYASYGYNENWKFEIHYSETIKYLEEWKLILSQLVNKSLDELSGEQMTSIMNEQISSKLDNI